MKKTRHSTKYRQLLAEIKLARKNAGLTQKDVGKKFGTHASFVSKCESGERRVDVIELAKFCHIYGIEVSQILEKIGIR